MRRLVQRNLEAILVLALFAIFGLLKVVLANKFAFLNLYFIPVLIAGYYLGKRRAILSSIASVLLATLFMIQWPGELIKDQSALYAGLNLVVWASLLVLSSILVSTLNEGRQHRLAAATLKWLEKYLRDTMGQPDNHPARVARLAKAIATELRLPQRLVDSIEAASLLHDLGDHAVGRELIASAGELAASTENRIVGEAVPILIGRERHGRGEYVLSIGSRIVTVADLYDSTIHTPPARGPWEAVREIESRARRSDGPVISALRRVVGRQFAGEQA